MTQPTDEPGVDPAERNVPVAPDTGAVDPLAEVAPDSEAASLENAPQPASHIRQRTRPRRGPALVVAAVLVGAGVFLALRGMQQVVARAPATPVPAAISTPAPTSNEGSASPTPQPTPMPTSSALILEP